MNILFIAFEFPPVSTTGSVRPLKFAKYLPGFNINPIIICPDIEGLKNSYPGAKEENNLLKELPADIPVIRIPVKDVSAIANNKFRSFLHHYFTFEDSLRKKWRKNVLAELPGIIEKYKPVAIYCTAPPFSIATLAKEISRKTNLPLLLDMRDNWSLWGISAYISYIHYYFSWLNEKRALTQASKIVSVTTQVINDFKNAHKEIDKSKFLVIPNGFEEFPGMFSPLYLKRSDKIRVGYMGEFYFNPTAHDSIFLPWYKKRLHRIYQYTPRKEDYKYRTPYYFFKTMRAFLNKYPEFGNIFEFHYIGSETPWLSKMVDEFKLQKNCIFYGKVSYSESLEIAKSNFDFCLSTSAKVIGGEDYSLASKTFDYISLRKPILGFLTSGAQKEFLEKSGIAFILDPDDISGNNLEKMYRIFNTDIQLAYNETFLRQFIRKNTAKRMSDVIKSMIIGAPPDSQVAEITKKPLLVSKIDSAYKKFYFILNPYHWRILFSKAELKEFSITKRLQYSMEWLLFAKKKSRSTGISFGYSLFNGWTPAYPETNGYIISSLINYYQLTNEMKWLNLAVEIGDWEIQIQKADGSVRVGNEYNENSDVFDTGMVLEGFVRLFISTGFERYLNAARKAADWLIHVMNPDGSWDKFTFKDIPHVYHTLVAQAILRFYKLEPHNKYLFSVTQNLNWALSQKQPDGWFHFQGFSTDEDPYTHTMAYFIQGMLEIYKENHEKKFNYLLPVIEEYCLKLIDKFHLDTVSNNNLLLLPGQVNSNWTSDSRYTCLTGNAQFSGVFYDLYKLTSNSRYLVAADNLLSIVASCQSINKISSRFLGSVAGSYPLNGAYHPYEFPNWPVKFFADALMKKIELIGKN